MMKNTTRSPRSPRSEEMQMQMMNNEAVEQDQKAKTSKGYMALLITNYVMLMVGSVSASLVSKYYFIHKGSSRWVSTFVQSAGFPLLLPPIFLPYYLLRSTTRRPFTHFTPKILSLSILVGLFLGLNNLLISWGNSYLPVSTSSLLLSSQLLFNLIFSVIIVKQTLSFLNLNCVVLLTLSSVLLAIGSAHDKSNDLSKSKYFIGFFCTVGAGLLFSLYLPVMEKIYRKVYCYSMVMEMQLVMEMAATALATVGMASDDGYSEMRREAARVFDRGVTGYCLTIIGNVVTWQLCFMGTAGMVFLTSSLTGGICTTAILAMNVIGGVVVYGDRFSGVKAVSTVLCVWGVSSYVYGMYVNIKRTETKRDNNNNLRGADDDDDDDDDLEKFQGEKEMVQIHNNNNNNNNNNLVTTTSSATSSAV